MILIFLMYVKKCEIKFEMDEMIWIKLTNML